MIRAKTLFTKAPAALLPAFALAIASCGIDDMTADNSAPAGDPSGAPAALPTGALRAPTGALGAVVDNPVMQSNSDRRGIGAMPLVINPRLVPTAIDPRRSLTVTDQVITSTFSLQAVLDQLAAQSGVAGMTGLQLFTQLWDTQNTAAAGATTGPHCDDNAGTVNGFTYACRPTEGGQAFTAAASIASYQLIGLFNRFDLASVSGSDCGEHRMVFGRPGGGGRAFIIFEAIMPNPTPALGLEGCRPIAQFWAGLTSNPSATSRATALHNFYFNGLSGFDPVIHINHYGNGASGLGQVRVNAFLAAPWMLREFKLLKTSATRVVFQPVSVKTNPFGELFAPAFANPNTAAFQNTFFPSQVAALAVSDINLFNYVVPDNFNAGQSISQNFGATDDYSARFSTASTLATNIQTQLTAIGSTLTPANIVARAEALSCGGCHELSNAASIGGGLTWPSSAGFVQATEFTEAGPDGTRFQISGALSGTFLPHRARVLQAFLDRLPSASDYDGDRKADVAVFDPSALQFITRASSSGVVTTRTFGAAGDTPVGGADFDGDHKADMVTFRSSDNTWHILTSSSGFATSSTVTWGLAGDLPVSGDYDGDGKADIATFRPSDGTWNILTSSSGFTASTSTKFGVNTDQPLSGADYDGDGKADIVIWRHGPRTMNVLQSSTGTLLTRTLGVPNDIVVAATDFDGDGRPDMVSLSPTTFKWTVATSSTNWQTTFSVTWGTSGDIPLAGTDFDGDGRADFVIYRPSDHTYRILFSNTNFTSSSTVSFGAGADQPLGR
ncbi:MAG TPA: VCBS repeat-containing protein [Kofleriaceae bacterium]|jgi:hypothetical protein|nr:VCBS repeat-containing protein [Kofleriaceae bacterium]